MRALLAPHFPHYGNTILRTTRIIEMIILYRYCTQAPSNNGCVKFWARRFWLWCRFHYRWQQRIISLQGKHCRLYDSISLWNTGEYNNGSTGDEDQLPPANRKKRSCECIIVLWSLSMSVHSLSCIMFDIVHLLTIHNNITLRSLSNFQESYTRCWRLKAKEMLFIGPALVLHFVLRTCRYSHPTYCLNTSRRRNSAHSRGISIW